MYVCARYFIYGRFSEIRIYDHLTHVARIQIGTDKEMRSRKSYTTVGNSVSYASKAKSLSTVLIVETFIGGFKNLDQF